VNIVIRVSHLVLLALLVIVILSGCGASYQYKHVSANGTSCQLTIWSARDVQAGDIKISKSCALSGGADSLTANQQAMEAISSLVQKIP